MHDIFAHFRDTDGSTVWLVIGMLGQALFTGRFFVQWIASERAGKSVVPDAFWYFSILGGLTLLVYAIWRMDPVFIIGQGTGLFIYARNLYFIRRKDPAAVSPTAVATPDE